MNIKGTYHNIPVVVDDASTTVPIVNVSGDGGDILLGAIKQLTDRSMGVDVTEYGAKGDGTTDDTLAIQTCINNHAITLITKPGIYILSDILAQYGVSENGDYWRVAVKIASDKTIIMSPGVVIKMKSGALCAMWGNSNLIAGNSNINLLGGTWDGNGVNNPSRLTPLDYFPQFNTVFSRLTNCTIAPYKIQRCAKYALFCAGHINDCTIGDIVFDTESDGFHLNAPFNNVRVGILSGYTNDNKLAIVAREGYNYYRDVNEVLTGRIGKHLYCKGVINDGRSKSPVRFVGGPSDELFNIHIDTVLNDAGSGDLIQFADDGTPGTTGTPGGPILLGCKMSAIHIGRVSGFGPTGIVRIAATNFRSASIGVLDVPVSTHAGYYINIGSNCTKGENFTINNINIDNLNSYMLNHQGTCNVTIGTLNMRVANSTNSCRILNLTGNAKGTVSVNGGNIISDGTTNVITLYSNASNRMFVRFNNLHIQGKGTENEIFNIQGPVTVNHSGCIYRNTGWTNSNNGGNFILIGNGSNHHYDASDNDYKVGRLGIAGSGVARINDPNFPAAFDKVTPLLGDRFWATNTGGKNLCTQAGPVICKVAGAIGTATFVSADNL